MKSALTMPPCPCPNPNCQSTDVVVNEMLSLLHTRFPNHEDVQLVAAMACLSRLAVAEQIPMHHLLELIIEQTGGIVLGLRLQANGINSPQPC